MTNSKENNGVPIIELEGVTKEFPTARGAVAVLRNITMRAEQGEHIAIVGKSGSGKSTLLNMVTGIDHPSRGSVRIGSTEIHRLDESRLAKWRGENVGIVFQFFQLIPTLTIRENLLLPMDLVACIPKRERKGRVEDLLSQVGIEGHGDKLPSALSGGEQQRAAIARAIANDPPLLVADEPTGNLDSKTADAIQSLFAGLARIGKTVIVVTHEDVSHSDYGRIISLHDGEVVGDKRST